MKKVIYGTDVCEFCSSNSLQQLTVNYLLGINNFHCSLDWKVGLLKPFEMDLIRREKDFVGSVSIHLKKTGYRQCRN